MYDDEKFMVQNGFIGNCMCFWAQNDQGYTCHINKAERYTLEEAQKRCRPDENEKVWPESAILAGATMQVDHQKVKHELHEELTPPKTPYKKPPPINCEGCGRFLTDRQAYCGCDNCGSAP